MNARLQKWVFILIVAVVFLAGAVLFLHTSLRSDTGTFDGLGQRNVGVVLTDEGFVPQSIRIQEGTTVTFTTTRKNEFWPASNPHPSHFIYSGFDPREPIQPGNSWSYTFERVGVHGYHDHIRSYFTGIIYVES